MRESVKIIEQALDGLPEGPHIADDRKYVLPPRSELSTSMEALIHHFKLVTEGYRVPPGEVYRAIESPRGELGCYLLADGSAKPARVHFRDPSFVNLQALRDMCVGGYVADLIAEPGDARPDPRRDRPVRTEAHDIATRESALRTSPSAGGPARGPETPLRPDGTPGLPVDAALVDGRFQARGGAMPELHEVDCPPELQQQVEELMSRYPDRHSASIPALWAVAAPLRLVHPEGIRQAAAVMRVTPAYLESVASFYDLLHTEPAGNQRVLVCTNISCWMRGGDELLDAFCAAAGCDREGAGHGGSVSADGEVYVSGFECLGACDLAPMASINGRYFGPLEDTEAVTALEQLRSGSEVLPEKALERRPLAGGPEGEPDSRVAGKRGPNQ